MISIEPLYDKQCTCPLCNTFFTTKKVRTRFVKMTNLDADFFPTYVDYNPLLYYINVCPDCGFSFHDETSTNFSLNEKMMLIEKVSIRWTPRSFGNKRTITDAIIAYKLAAYCSLLRQEKHIVTAGIYLRLAWMYRLINEAEQEQRFMKLALQEYEASYMSGDYIGTKVSELTTLYLIGELSRRTDQINQATKYFSKVIEKQSKTIETNIIRLAKEGWYKIREVQNI
ncbi:DUF2225 domain-containing protein [Niallia sp. 01092]|uniref:DUF2225 domain-containing protein n=1 Tax=unclassified Niallia TaxID=2837522 RepID=UPI003FD1A2F8